ncbi:MAG: RIO1 family regulatory kinase/ATPase [Salinirussus sp.]
MPIRKFVRGSVDRGTLDRVAAEVGARHELPGATVEPLEANNWLSTPVVVGAELFVKVITPQNALVHAVLTAGRNLGVFSSGTEGFFERFETPVEMARHEFEATRRMHEAGLNVPEPLEAFEFEGAGVLVLEYLKDMEPLGAQPSETVAKYAPALFEMLDRMHKAGVVHGDLRGENVLLADGALYVIDATKVRPEAFAEARAYDIACALAAIEGLVDARTAVAAAAQTVDAETLLAAESFLDFVSIRPDHDFDARALEAEIGRMAV